MPEAEHQPEALTSKGDHDSNKKKTNSADSELGTLVSLAVRLNGVVNATRMCVGCERQEWHLHELMSSPKGRFPRHAFISCAPGEAGRDVAGNRAASQGCQTCYSGGCSDVRTVSSNDAGGARIGSRFAARKAMCAGRACTVMFFTSSYQRTLSCAPSHLLIAYIALLYKYKYLDIVGIFFIAFVCFAIVAVAEP
eukprot:2433323-Amphidinium_carterae.1